MLRLHTEMFGEVWSWAGRIRSIHLSIGSDPGHIAEHLAQLCDDIHGREPYLPDLLEQAVLIHHRAVQIHPFRNGNGRWARMLSNIWLRVHQQPLVEWPATIGRESPIRAEYLASLRSADSHDLKAAPRPPPPPSAAGRAVAGRGERARNQRGPVKRPL